MTIYSSLLFIHSQCKTWETRSDSHKADESWDEDSLTFLLKQSLQNRMLFVYFLRPIEWNWLFLHGTPCMISLCNRVAQWLKDHWYKWYKSRAVSANVHFFFFNNGLSQKNYRWQGKYKSIVWEMYAYVAYRFRMYQTPVSAPASQVPDRSHAVRYSAITYTAWSEKTV